MKKLMKNNGMKFVICVGFFYGTNFGMENTTATRRIPLNNDNRKKQECRLQQQIAKNKKEDDACNERCLESCENCCLSAFLPVMSAVVLMTIRVITDDTFSSIVGR